MSNTDLDLLRQFVENQSQDAFSGLVREHLDFVYSSALRQVRSPDLAAEVSQSVFLDLANEAGRLKPDTILAAWLYQVTRRTAVDLIRRESRRQARERLAAEMTDMNASSTDWSHIEPLLDDAMDSLDEADRAAILLRFFQDKSLREVGDALGTSDDAAQKRVSRAVEKLREFFGKRGVAVGSGALAALIAANSVQAAPAALAVTISSSAGAAILASTAPTAAISSVTKAITMTTLQKAVLGTAFVASIGFGVFEARQASNHRGTAATLRQQNESLTAQMDQLREEASRASNRFALLRSQPAAGGGSNDELLQLRAEVTRLRQQVQASASLTNSGDPTVEAMNAWVGRVKSLKARLEQNPGSSIPEIKLMTEQDWLQAAQGSLNSEEDYLKALSRLRTIAETKFITNVANSIQHFQKANNNGFPMSFAELRPFFAGEIDPAILDRWEIVPAETVPNIGVGEWVVTQKAPVDPKLDQRFVVGDSGSYGSTTFTTSPFETLAPAISAFFSATGKAPSDPAELLPYLSSDAQKAELQKQSQVIQQLKPEERAVLQKHIQQMLQFSNIPSPR